MTARQIILFVILMSLAWVCHWLATGTRLFAVALVRAGRACKRLSGDRTAPGIGDRVMVVSWHKAFPAGSVGCVLMEAINHDTQRFEYQVRVGGKLEWIPATAVARMNRKED